MIHIIKQYNKKLISRTGNAKHQLALLPLSYIAITPSHHYYEKNSNNGKTLSLLIIYGNNKICSFFLKIVANQHIICNKNSNNRIRPLKVKNIQAHLGRNNLRK